MDSQDQVTDPPALAPSQQQSDDSQDALQDGSSRSSSQMPELEQMESAAEQPVGQVVVEGEEAMEVERPQVTSAPEEAEPDAQQDDGIKPAAEVATKPDEAAKDMEQAAEDEGAKKKVDGEEKDKEEEESGATTSAAGEKESTAKGERQPDTKIVLTLAPGASPSKGQTEKAAEGGKREVVLSFNMQDMLAATDGKQDDGEISTTPVSINVAVPHQTRASKRAATTVTKQSPTSSAPAAKKQRGGGDDARSTEFAQAIGLRSTSTPPATPESSVRRSNRRKSGTPKWRPKDLLETESEGESSSAEEGEVRPIATSQTKKRGRPSKTPTQSKKATPTPAAKKVKVKKEPGDRVRIKVEESEKEEWYNGKPKLIWSKKEQRALVTYITDWQKQPPMEDIEEEEEEEEQGRMSQKEFDEMSLLIPEKGKEKDWKDCAELVSKSTQKPIRSVSDCYDFAMTIHECMTNEGVMEHYNLDSRKVKAFIQSMTSKKPLRKQADGKAFWTDEEEQALVVFILNWQIKPKAKMIKTKVKVTKLNVVKPSKDSESDEEFIIMAPKSNLWEDCARFISRKACLPKRTGAACRSYAQGIQKKYTKEEAIKHYNLDDEEVDSDVEEIGPTAASYDAYMQDDSFMFNLWISEMGRLTRFQEDHVLHRLLLKKIDRNEFSANEFLYYFKHMTRARQEETADLLLAHGHGGSDEKEVEDGSQSKPPSSQVIKFQAFAGHKRRSLDNFDKQMQINLHQSEKQLKNLREMLNKIQKENKSLKARIKSLKDVVDRMGNSRPSRQAWSVDMDAELNHIRKTNLFQWMLMNGFIPRMPREDLVLPKGLFYCIFTAMEELQAQGRPNAVFHLAKALCLRKTNGERVMPANRMPFAMLEANIMFFGGKGYNFIQQEGYKRWVETQYAWFGEVWFSLFGGPNMKSLAGEEPKPLMGPIDDQIQVKKERVYSYSYKSKAEHSDDQRFTLSMCPEGFTPPEDERKEYIKVGERWGKMHPIEESMDMADEEKTADDQSPVPARKITRRSGRASTEGEASTSQDLPPTANSTPGRGRRRGKTAAISYMTKEPRRPIKVEPHVSTLDIDDVDKFLQEVNDGVLPEGLTDIWDDPPDFTFEDDFVVPENSDLNKVRLNIVSGTPRAVRRRAVERANISEPDATIRVELLQQLQQINPHAKWWIKTGWCDISVNKSLRITTNQEFTGDEDLGDGAVQEAEQVYKDRLKYTRVLGTLTRKSENALREDLFRQIAELQNDNVFLCEGLRQVRATRGIYKNKMGVPERAAVDAQVEKEISSYTKLLEKNQHLRSKVERALTQGAKARVITLRNDLADYLGQVTIRQRTLANYVLIFMISDELQNENPHSWPVRMVPVTTVTKEIVETLREQLIEAMAKENMQIVGVIRDELTPHLQVARPERPVCITQLITESRTEVSTFHPSEMEKYFTTVTLFSRSGDMKLTPQWRHGAVPEEDVLWVHKHMADKNVSFLEALQALHNSLFPDGYQPHPFKQITKFVDMDAQMLEDQLRALMAIYIYRHKIRTYVAEGVDFDSYLYNPSPHPVTKEVIHVRDSVTKLLRAVSRQAKDDPELPLEKKERLSRALDSWFKASVNAWWTGDMRKEGNQALFSFFMEEWVPWLSTDRGYSTVDVNRPIRSVCFLTEELFTSLLINLESDNQRPSLHPIAATCQDVNTFVHLIKNPGQRHNDSRQIMHPQIIKKLCIEFAKAVDLDLEFYYYWGDHEKTLYNILLNLNDPRTKRSATGPKYRKKSMTPKKGGKMLMKAELEEIDPEEEDENSRDAMEEDMEEEMMDVSGVNAEEEDSMASSTNSKTNQPPQIIEVDHPIPISINQADIVMAPSSTINQEDIDTAQALHQLSDMETIQVFNQGNMQVMRVVKHGEAVKVANQGEGIQVVSRPEEEAAAAPVEDESQGEDESQRMVTIKVEKQAEMEAARAERQEQTVQMAANEGQMAQVVSQEEATDQAAAEQMQNVQRVAVSQGQTIQMSDGQMVQVVSQEEPTDLSVSQGQTIQMSDGQMVQVVSQEEPTDLSVSQGQTIQMSDGQMVQVVSQGEAVQAVNEAQMQNVQQVVVSQGQTIQMGDQVMQVVSQGEPVHHAADEAQMQTVQAVGHHGQTIVSQGQTIQMGDQIVQVVSEAEAIQAASQGQMVQVISQGEHQGQVVHVIRQGESVGDHAQMMHVVSEGQTIQMGSDGQMVQVVDQSQMETVHVDSEGNMVQVVNQEGMETVQMVNQGEAVQQVADNQSEMQTVQVVNQEGMEAIQMVNQGEAVQQVADNQSEMQTVQVVSQGEIVQMANEGQMVEVVHQDEMESVEVVNQEGVDTVVDQGETAETVQVVDQPTQATTQVITVTTSAPTVTTQGGGGSGQPNSQEDIIAAELLRQIEASLQAGGAVVTVTEGQSSEGQSQN